MCDGRRRSRFTEPRPTAAELLIEMRSTESYMPALLYRTQWSPATGRQRRASYSRIPALATPPLGRRRRLLGHRGGGSLTCC